jgi:hypothetical protein
VIQQADMGTPYIIPPRNLPDSRRFCAGERVQTAI